MEPFEISLKFPQVEGNEKNSTGFLFFSSAPRRKVLGNLKSNSTVKWLSVCLLISLGLRLICVFCAGLWGFSQNIYFQEMEGCCFFVLSGSFPSLPWEIPAWSLSFFFFLAWQSSLLSLTSPLGTNLCSLKTSECYKTRSNMQHCHAPQADSRHKIYTVISSCSSAPSYVCTMTIFYSSNEMFGQCRPQDHLALYWNRDRWTEGWLGVPHCSFILPSLQLDVNPVKDLYYSKTDKLVEPA